MRDVQFILKSGAILNLKLENFEYSLNHKGDLVGYKFSDSCPRLVYLDLEEVAAVLDVNEDLFDVLLEGYNTSKIDAIKAIRNAIGNGYSLKRAKDSVEAVKDGPVTIVSGVIRSSAKRISEFLENHECQTQTRLHQK